GADRGEGLHDRAGPQGLSTGETGRSRPQGADGCQTEDALHRNAHTVSERHAAHAAQTHGRQHDRGAVGAEEKLTVVRTLVTTQAGEYSRGVHVGLRMGFEKVGPERAQTWFEFRRRRSSVLRSVEACRT